MERKRLQTQRRAGKPPIHDSPVPTIFLPGERLTPAKPEVKEILREGGIYALSDGREFVAHAVFRGGYVFYTREDWDCFGPHAYESNADGRMRWNGQPDQWRIEDLIDTSRTARSRSRKVA
jgi:hypothetical protein